MNIIDPHIHLFNVKRGQYHWLKPENPPFWEDKALIYKDFGESELTLTNDLTLEGFVHIEAGYNNEEPWAEIEWLETQCKKPFKSVASIDLTLSPEQFKDTVNQLLLLKSVVGVRHLLDDDYLYVLQHPNTFNNFKLLALHHLSFDLQMPLSNPVAVTSFINVLSKLPNLRVVINHAGWPNFSLKKEHDQLEHNNWISGLTALSQFKQCSVKCSGWEMVDRHYSVQNAIQVIQSCIDAFGYNRVMLGSNFPLCLFTTNYQSFWHIHTDDIAKKMSITSEQLSKLCASNAKHWYKFQTT